LFSNTVILNLLYTDDYCLHILFQIVIYYILIICDFVS